ncbi:DUF6624 domain-containing protein [Dyella sp. A6]|uniref:DUF6624 domain-containing protein n=1 Tax=Dyella aluminiiresistens TaxID=3069105 RepID=UPI002E7AAEDD|nr:DUF6624 domain-containing protein [Dyella sp. A6]
MHRSSFAMLLLMTLTAAFDLHAAEMNIRIDPSTIRQPALHRSLLELDRQGHGTLDSPALTAFKMLIARYGWPTVPAAGRKGVDAAGDLALRAKGDYDFQSALENAMQSRIGMDIDARAFARLNDRIEIQHGHPQQFGSLLALDHGKVVTSPHESAANANPYRDSTGLPLLGPWLRQVQRAVDAGNTLQAIVATPSLATPLHRVTLPRLQAELAAMARADQHSRSAWMSTGFKRGSPEEANMERLDAAHLQRLRVILKHHGFPDATEVGRDGVENFWLLSQHAVSDTPFMTKVLDRARPLMLRGELSHHDYALMVDRVRVQQGRKQIYGTQTSIQDGHFVLYPIEDAAHLAQRRARMGLMPEAEYLKMGEQMLRHSHSTSNARKS